MFVVKFGVASVAVFGMVLLGGCASEAVMASGEAAQASVHVSASAGHAIAASGQAAFAASAVPLLYGQAVSNAAAASSGAAARASLNATGLPATGALPLTDMTFSVIPPDQALKQ